MLFFLPRQLGACRNARGVADVVRTTGYTSYQVRRLVLVAPRFQGSGWRKSGYRQDTHQTRTKHPVEG